MGFNSKYEQLIFQLLKVGLACNHIRRFDVKQILLGKFLFNLFLLILRFTCVSL